jgi:glucose/arabinose dehydrogenase
MLRSVTGFLLLLSLLFPTAAAGQEPVNLPKVPEGFQIEPVVQKVHHPTRVLFGPDGRLFIAQQTGEIVAVTLRGGQETARQQVAKANLHLLGIALREDQLWVSESGKIAVYTRTPDGRYTDRQEILTGIPHGLHQNDGFAWGSDGKLYWGLGSTTDRGPEHHPWSASIMRMNPNGSEPEVFARGFRNPFGIAFDPKGNLWVTDNGADKPVSSDELNLVTQGGDYGYPRVFGQPPPGSQTLAPVALFGNHNSTNGMAFYIGTQFPIRYRGQLFVAMWGSSFDETTGRAVGVVELQEQSGGGYTGQVSKFATGFDRPLDLTIGPNGDLWVADFVPGIIYRIWYEPPTDPVKGAPPGQSPGLSNDTGTPGAGRMPVDGTPNDAGGSIGNVPYAGWSGGLPAEANMNTPHLSVYLLVAATVGLVLLSGWLLVRFRRNG